MYVGLETLDSDLTFVYNKYTDIYIYIYVFL